ncbi:MAG: small multidrug resistance protein [Kovacikia sp.]
MPSYLYSPLLILVTVALNTLAQTLLKLGTGQPLLNPFLAGGILSYALSTLSYILLLARSNLSVAYPIVIGLTVLSTSLSATLLLGEKIPTSHWLALGLLLSAISTLSLGKIN